MGKGVSIPLRTGLGFERPGWVKHGEGPRSQSPYERVSDSNRKGWQGSNPGRVSIPLRTGLGFELRTLKESRARGVSIPLRTGLGFEQLSISQSRFFQSCLNPLTNGSRIRTTRPRSRPWGALVSIPLRTGLGFEPSLSADRARLGASQSPYERVSDSNAAGARRILSPPSLNPLTNGSRIRTTTLKTQIPARASVSIPLRTGLGFEPIAEFWFIAGGRSQSPYERVSDSNKGPGGFSFAQAQSQSPYERVSDSNGGSGPHPEKVPWSQSPYERVSDSNGLADYHLNLALGLNPLTNGSRIRTAPHYDLYRASESQSPYERVSDSNNVRENSRAKREVSIPLRTGLGFEPNLPSDIVEIDGSQSPYERVSDSNQGKGQKGQDGWSQSPYERVSDSNARV